MSITQLRAQDRPQRASRRPVGRWVRGCRSRRVRSRHELGEAIAELSALESQVAAWRLALAAEADVRRVADETADTDTTAWLMRLTADPRGRLGWDLAGPAVAGDLSGDPGGVRGRVVADRAGPGDRERGRAGPGRGDRRAAPRCGGRRWWPRPPGSGPGAGRPMNAKRLRQAARRMFATVSVELADRHESDQLNAEADRAEAETWCTLYDNGDGTFAGRFVIPELHGTVLKAALDRLTAPRHHTTQSQTGLRGPEGRLVTDPTLISTPNWSERLGMALLELIEHLPTGGFGAANTAGVLVTIGYDALVSGIGAAGLDTGVRISARDARRLACNAAIIPAVLGGQSQPLDLGRTRRLHSSCPTQGAGADPRLVCDRHLRPAVRVDRDPPPPPLVPGRQDRPGHALPLCGHHHRRAHDTRFDLRRHSHGDWRFHRRR